MRNSKNVASKYSVSQDYHNPLVDPSLEDGRTQEPPFLVEQIQVEDDIQGPSFQVVEDNLVEDKAEEN